MKISSTNIVLRIDVYKYVELGEQSSLETLIVLVCAVYKCPYYYY